MEVKWKCGLMTLLGILILANSVEFARSNELWCYQCNTDLSMGIKEECNDPYAPGPAIDLVECPQDQPHHCLKAHIFYNNVHATVRGCVPSGTLGTYCAIQNDEFSEARVTCKFCNDYACNGSSFTIGHYLFYQPPMLMIIIVILINIVF